jgi:non-heme Fe2+,alpha-ketoglutarate-dependent halogenase
MMPKILTLEQVANYQRDGYLYPVDVMSAQEAHGYLERLEASEAQQGQQLVKGANFKPHLIFKWADELAYHPRILDAVEDLVGPNIRILSSTVFPKMPGTGAFVDWHQDGTYFALEPDNLQLAVWVALSDAPVEAGCMEMAVGSHRLGQLSHREVVSEKHMLSLGQTVDDPFKRDDTEFMPLKAGQMSIHHTHTIHRSGPNRSSWRRVGVTLTYVPAQLKVRASVKPSAALVRGVDAWRNFEDEPRPRVDLGEEELRFQEHANALFRGVYADERQRYQKGQATEPAA